MAFKKSSVTWVGLMYMLAFTSLVRAQASDTYDQIDGLIREPLVLNVRFSDGQTATLDAFVTRPDKPGSWPIALITHGTDGDQTDRVISPNRFSLAAIAFARHGYASVVVMRQGYGKSSGLPEYQGGTCEHPHHARAGKLAADDLIAALQAVRLEPWSAPDEALLIGHSAGGFSVLAAGAENTQGVRAIINFDGGRGAKNSGEVCDKEHLLSAISAYGKDSRLPTLWMYAANDNVFPRPLSTEMFNTYVSAGGSGEFLEAPAFENDGHHLFEWAPEQLWWPQVADFLSRNELSYKERVPLAVIHLPAPEDLNASGKDSWRAYMENQSYEKAFATNGKGAWAWSKGERTREEASATAIDRCQTHTSGDAPACTVYAIGNSLVVKGPTPQTDAR
ncbi:dienelactone hydrolase [Pseudomonas asturiensis]|uniref:Dienelactone hydrolase n=1 Tax=Pseudomonas asturiensis TaxID=1190415 RepID=A0ABX6HHW3_9PSED|nr:alpha/beta hydrolase [Pseudomonas asturiensis]QHF05175.1 dienelactone hydrolase [Pseudomonas asturiensis]